MAFTIPDDDYSPRYVGDLSQPLVVTFTDHSNKTFDLSLVQPANMMLVFSSASNSALRYIGNGTWSTNLESAANGQATYTWDAQDVANVGVFNIQIEVPFVTGPQHFEIKVLEFLPVL